MPDNPQTTKQPETCEEWADYMRHRHGYEASIIEDIKLQAYKRGYKDGADKAIEEINKQATGHRYERT